MHEKIEKSKIMNRWIYSAVFISAILASAGASYYWCYQATSNQYSIMINMVQANSAYNRIWEDRYIVNLMKQGCFEGALNALEWNQKQQKSILYDLVQKGVGEEFLVYVEDRSPGLIDSLMAESHQKRSDFILHCPPQ